MAKAIVQKKPKKIDKEATYGFLSVIIDVAYFL